LPGDDRALTLDEALSIIFTFPLLVAIISGPMLGEWIVSVEGDELKIQMDSGGGKQAVVAQSDTVFLYPPIGGTVRFEGDGKGAATGFVVTIVEGDIPATRK